MSCGVDVRRCSDPAWLWLWGRPAATAPIWTLAWELLCAMGAALKIKWNVKTIERRLGRVGQKCVNIQLHAASAWSKRILCKSIHRSELNWKSWLPGSVSYQILTIITQCIHLSNNHNVVFTCTSFFFFFFKLAAPEALWKFPGQGFSYSHCRSNAK